MLAERADSDFRAASPSERRWLSSNPAAHGSAGHRGVFSRVPWEKLSLNASVPASMSALIWSGRLLAGPTVLMMRVRLMSNDRRGA